LPPERALIATLTLHRRRAAVALAALVSVIAAPSVNAQSPYPSPRPPADAGTDAIFKQYGFPAVSGLSRLCQQNVYPQGNPGWHLTWDAFASASTPAALVAEYRKRLDDTGFTKNKDGGMWRYPVNAATVDRALDIGSSDAPGPYRSCERKPPSGSRSIIMLSRKT